MPGGPANIGSPEVLRTFRHKFIAFTEEARSAVSDASKDAGAITEWLRREQLSYWKQQFRRREEESERARRAYVQARSGDKYQGKTSSIDERKLYERAKRLRDEAEQKIRLVQQFLSTLEHKTMTYLQPCARLSTLLATEAPKAVARLDQMLDSLDDYLRQSPSTSK